MWTSSYKKRLAAELFKHADNDPEDILEFYPTGGSRILWAAIEKYYELTKRISRVGAFRIWIIIRIRIFFSRPTRSSRAVGPRERLLCGMRSAVFRSRVERRCGWLTLTLLTQVSAG